MAEFEMQPFNVAQGPDMKFELQEQPNAAESAFNAYDLLREGTLLAQKLPTSQETDFARLEDKPSAPSDGTKIKGHKLESGRFIIDEIDYPNNTSRKFSHDNPADPSEITSFTEPSGRTWKRNDINGRYGLPLWESGKYNTASWMAQSGYVDQVGNNTIDFSHKAKDDLFASEPLVHEQFNVETNQSDIIDFDKMK